MEMVMMMIRVLLADDHPAVRAGVRAALEANPDIEVVGEAASRDEAFRTCLATRPDVLILDLSMSGRPILGVIADLRSVLPASHIVILSAYDPLTQIRQLMGIGIAGYLLKDEPLDTLVDAVRIIARGGNYFSRAIMVKLLPSHPASPIDAIAASLTEREQQLLRLLCSGWDVTRIADMLGLSERTVRNYCSLLYTKLDVHSRAEATSWAQRNGLAEGW